MGLYLTGYKINTLRKKTLNSHAASALTHSISWADANRRLLFTLLGAAYLLGFNGQWRINADGALYLTLARNLARGDGYTYHGALHGLVYAGVPEMLSLGFRWCGKYAIVADDLLMVLCGWLALGATYRLIQLAYGRPTAVAVTLLTGIAHEFYRYSFEMLVEIPFLAGVMALLAGMEGIFYGNRRVRWWDWGLLIGGACVAVSTKPMMLALFGICAADALRQGIKRKIIGRTVWAIGIMAACLTAFCALDPRHAWSGRAPSSYEAIAVREIKTLPQRWRIQVRDNISDLLQKSVTRSVVGTPVSVPFIGPALSVAILGSALALIRFRPAWGLWVGAIAMKMTLFYSHDRYLLPVLPLLMLGWWNLARLQSPVLAALLIGGTVFCNLGMTAGVIVEQHRTPFVVHYRHGSYAPLEGMARKLRGISVEADVIMGPSGSSRIATFLADRIAIEPGQPMLKPGQGGRLLVIEANPPNPTEAAWLGNLGVCIEGPPLAVSGDLLAYRGVKK